MSCPVNTFNKSKEDFIWFVKKAVNDKKSYSHSEMYHSLLKLFVDAGKMNDLFEVLKAFISILHRHQQGRPGQQGLVLQVD